MTAAFLSLLADHAVLVCVGLLAAAALAWPARALLKRDPQACYQLLLALLVGAVAVLPLQLFVQGRAAPLAAPARDWLRSLRWPGGGSDGTNERAAPEPQKVPFETYLVDAAPAAHETATTPRPARNDPPKSDGTVASQGASTASVADAPSPGTTRSFAAGIAARAGRVGRAVARLARNIGWERAAAGLWLLGVAFIASRRLLRAVRTVRLVAQAQPVADPATLSLWRNVGRDSRIAARVRLVASDAVESPACTGLVRRVLILPARPSRPLAPEVLEWALRHELVHLERGDQWAALFQSAVTALLWFHPAAWWLSGEIGRLRELSCDQRVVEASGRRRSYALALLECAASVSNPITAIDADPHSAGVRCALLHWSRSPTQIRRRIEMLTVESQSLPRTRKVLGILLASCALAVPAIAQVAGAATLLPARQEAPTPPPAPQATSAAASSQDAVPAPAAPVAPKKKRHHVVAPAEAAPAPSPLAPCPPCPPCDPCDPCMAPPAPANCPPTGDLAPCVATIGVDAIADPALADGGSDCCATGACDDGTEQYSAAVRAQVRAAQRQIELALKQMQRAQVSQQSNVKRELDQARKQEERVRAQREKKRSAIDARIADADEESQRSDLQRQLAEVEAAAERETVECDRRCEDLEAKLAQMADAADLSDCFEGLGDFQESMDGEVAELKESIREVADQAAEQAKRSARAGDPAMVVRDGGSRGQTKACAEDAERLAKRAQAATQQARARLEQSLARAGQCGAVNAATQRQIEEALARVEQVDAVQVKQAVERAVVAAQRAAADRKRVAVAGSGATGNFTTEPSESDDAPRPRVARANGVAARSPTPAPREETSPRSASAGRPMNPIQPPRATRPGGEVNEARLLEKIAALEAEIESLRADLERLHAQAPVPADAAPVKRVREMR